jgi:hypothetical protein
MRFLELYHIHIGDIFANGAFWDDKNLRTSQDLPERHGKSTIWIHGNLTQLGKMPIEFDDLSIKKHYIP